MFLRTNLAILIYYTGKLLVWAGKYLLQRSMDRGLYGCYASVFHGAFILSRFTFKEGVVRYFIGLSNDPERRKPFLGWVLFSTTGMYVLLCLAMYLGRDYVYWLFSRETRFLAYLPYTVAVGYAMAISITLKAWCRASNRIIVPYILHYIVLQTLMFVNSYAYIYHQSTSYLLWGAVLAYALLALCFIAYLFFHGEWKPNWRWHTLGKTFFMGFSRYGLVSMVSNGLLLLVDRMDHISLLTQCGASVAGLYDMVVTQTTFIEAPMKVAQQTTEVDMAVLIAKKDRDGLAHLYKKTAVYQAFTGGLLFLLIHTNLPLLFGNLPPDQFRTIASLFLILATGELVEAPFGISQRIILFSKHFILSVISALISAAGIYSMRWTIDLWGVYGAAGSLLLTALVRGVFSTALVWRHFRIQPFSILFVIITLFSLLLCGVLPHLQVAGPTWWSYGLRIILICVGYGVIWLLLRRKFHKQSIEVEVQSE